MSCPSIRVLIVDDHPVVREGLKSLLATQPDMVVVGEAGSGREAFELVRRLRPDVTLLDLRLPDTRGTEAISALLHAEPTSKVIVVSSYGGDADIRSSLEVGAQGYLLKDAPREEIFAAIRCVANGEPFVSHHAASRLVQGTRLEKLTHREQEVLELMGDGRSNEEIAELLDLGVGTVKTHVHNILAKLGARDRTAAVTTALRRGLVRSR